MKSHHKKYLPFVVLVAIVSFVVFGLKTYLFANFNATDGFGQLDGSLNMDFTLSIENNSAGIGNINNMGFDTPSAIAIDTDHHRLFVADKDNNRVLVFNLSATNNITDRVADYVIGQPDFVSGSANQGGAPAANTLNGPYGLTYENNRLYVADSNNNRILVFDVRNPGLSLAICSGGLPSTGIATNMNAGCVIGQSDFVSGEANRTPGWTTFGDPVNNPTANTLYLPYGMSVDTSRGLLFASDRYNHRVLTYNLILLPATNAAASYVFGQTAFTNMVSGTAAQNIMNQPADTEFDPVHQRLFVADGQNRRVLVFDVRDPASPATSLCPAIDPTTRTGMSNGMNASCIIGQSAWTTNNGATSDHEFQIVFGLAYNPTNETLYVLDQGSRIVTFNVTTISAWPNEIGLSVFGQPDFVTAGGTNHSAGGIKDPLAIDYNPVNDQFYVADSGFNRVLYYEFITVTSNTLLSGTVGFNYSEPIAYTDSQGVVSMAVVSGSLPPGLSISGTSLVGMPTLDSGPYPMSYTFQVQATDNAGTPGVFLSPPHDVTVIINLLPRGVDVSETDITTTEFGTTADFTVALTSPTMPGEDVTIDLTSLDLSEGTVSPSLLTFTNGNWSIPQTVTVTGQDDLIADGDIVYLLQTSPTHSTYSEYDEFPAPDVSVTNIDNDIPGVSVDVSLTGHTSEALTTTTFAIRLNTIPIGTVTIPLTSDDLTEGTIPVTNVVFNSLNWNIPQTITITGVDDSIADGDIPYNIVTGAITAPSDPLYVAYSAVDVATVNDDVGDVAGVSVTPISNNTTEAGITATFDVVLTSQPVDDVTIDLLSNDTSEGTIVVSTLTFTTLNWNIAQTVTVTGVDDTIDDGDISYKILLSDAQSVGDAVYNNMDVTDVDVVNVDNDEPAGGGVVLIEYFDLIILSNTATSANAQFIVSSAGGGGLVWDMVYSTDLNVFNTPETSLPHIPWLPQINGISIPRGATHMYVKYFERGHPNHTSQVIARPLMLFDDPIDPPSSGECTPLILKYMQLGANNDSAEVIKLQTFLREEEGFNNLEITGIYDRATYNAVYNFQERYFGDILSPWFNKGGTGRVFVTTKKKINELHCANMAKPLSECRQFTKYARINSLDNDNVEVKKIQDFLASEAFLTTDSSTSGVFDQMLDQAIRNFQLAYSVDVIEPWGSRDQESGGWWYVTTQAKANELYCSRYSSAPTQ